MTYYAQITENNFLNRYKRAREIRAILKDVGLTRSFWEYPNSEQYSNGKTEARVFSEFRLSEGQPPNAIEPYIYGFVGVLINGHSEPILEEKINSWHREHTK